MVAPTPHETGGAPIAAHAINHIRPAPTTKRPTMTVSNRAWAELLLLSAVWSTSFLATQIVLREMGPVTLVMWRVASAATALWLVMAARGIAPPKGARVWGALMLMGLLNNAIPFALISWGQESIETGLAAILNASTALFAALVAALILPDQRLTAGRLTGICVGLCGVAAAVGPGAVAGLDPRSLGQLAVIGAAVAYAFASVWARLRLTGLHPVAAAAGMTGCATVWILPAALMIEGTPTLAMSAPGWGALAWLSLVGTAGAYLLYYRVLALAGPANLMLVTMIIPPMAILIGAWVLKERVGPGALLGLALIILGLVIIDGRVWAQLRRRRAARLG
ncbi:MAG: drug/metabolite transporter (DMT)-like permease [Paracoccaceae bacterium]|jgi:drug/metabolite transporter (DMT)-like permease